MDVNIYTNSFDDVSVHQWIRRTVEPPILESINNMSTQVKGQTAHQNHQSASEITHV